MIDKVLAESPHSIISVGSRRGALAGLLAGVAGVQTARGRKKQRSKNRNKNKNKNAGSEKVRQEAKKKKGKGQGGAPAQPPTVMYVLNSNNITGITGEVSGTAECPTGFVAIGGGFDVPGDFATGLLAQFPEDNGSKWRVTVNIPNSAGEVTLEVTAVCLKAKLEEGA